MTVLDWLLDSDPAIRWQALRDLVHAPAEVVAAERARVANEGWGARLLALQGEDGQWAGGACFPARSINWRDENQGQPWTATLPTLQLLRDFGVDPGADRVRRAVALVRDHCRWEHAGQPFFSGEVEPCINGRTVTLGTYFGRDVDGVVARLLGEQLEDGGWNCEAENGSVRSSFATTINVLEGLLAYEHAIGGSAESIAARRRGEEYLLERKLARRKSTGDLVNPAWLQFSFPTRWHYDVLRALEYFRSAGDVPDSRMGEAIDVLRSKQQPDGTWLLENTHAGQVHFALEDGDGRPSRWNTLRALRVLRWYEQSAPGAAVPHRARFHSSFPQNEPVVTAQSGSWGAATGPGGQCRRTGRAESARAACSERTAEGSASGRRTTGSSPGPGIPGGALTSSTRSAVVSAVTDRVPIRLVVNGTAHACEVEPRWLLSDVLRGELGLTGTHVGCEHGACGACTVLVDGEPVRSCLMFAVQATGAGVTTVEGLAASGDGALSPLQDAFRAEHGLQCGFCTPGILMSMTAFLRDHTSPTEAEIRHALSGHLCRCTGYTNIVRAVKAAHDRLGR